MDGGSTPVIARNAPVLAMCWIHFRPVLAHVVVRVAAIGPFERPAAVAAANIVVRDAVAAVLKEPPYPHHARSSSAAEILLPVRAGSDDFAAAAAAVASNCTMIATAILFVAISRPLSVMVFALVCISPLTILRLI